ncbi:molybdopterin-guanine dinucleotide biosynthesis protein B [Halomonas sp. C22]|uniref:molybdopterin-guanine dinucleotide biosynthesis protein B n=1 Tax=Halomonas sp. C22 TaxID=2580567 RepID=UPI0011A492B7|nr:molybdopterin-guanine dinucleotide biosynthesis protein B [Halomonas sp. C22]
MKEPPNCGFPVLGVAAWSGTGKTTLLEQLLPRLRALGLSVAVIKHAHHQFEVDHPGKDSYQLRKAGAAPMLVASSRRLALMMDMPTEEEPDLAYLLSLMAPHAPDLVIVEGFKAWPIAKLVLYREGIGDAHILDDPHGVGVALSGAAPVPLREDVMRLNLDDIDGIARWVFDWAAEQRHSLIDSKR